MGINGYGEVPEGTGEGTGGDKQVQVGTRGYRQVCGGYKRVHTSTGRYREGTGGYREGTGRADATAGSISFSLSSHQRRRRCGSCSLCLEQMATRRGCLLELERRTH